MKNLMKRLLFLILAALIAGCKPAGVNLAGSSINAGLQAWIDAPLEGTVLDLPARYMLVCHGTDPSGIQALEFSADSQVLSVLLNPDVTETLFNGSISWEPGSAGTYTIRCRAQNQAGDWSSYANARLIVVHKTPTPTQTHTASATFTPTFTHTPAVTFTPTETPTQVSTLTPTATSTSSPTLTPAAITFSSQVSTTTFEYQRDCIPNPGEVTITAKLDGAAGVKYVYLFFRLESSERGVTTEWNIGVPMNLGRGGEYRTTISWRDIPQLSQVMGSSVTFVYQFVAIGENNARLGKSELFRDITIGPCR